MLRALAFLAVALILVGSGSAGHAADIDETYVKQGGGAWGQLFKRYFPTAGEFGKSYALVIGIGDYDHYTNLRAPANDAVQMRDFLRDQAGFDYIVTLTNSAATPERINRLMDVELPGLVRRNDRFLFYFSGHGSTRPFGGDNKRGYLVLKEAGLREWDRMIAMPRVLDWAENFSAAQHVLFLLDACFSGLAATQMKSGEYRQQTLERLMDPAHLLVTAGTEDQESYTIGDRSLFTAAFIQAVESPDADFTKDGIVSLDEIEIFVRDQLDRHRGRGLVMTPTRWKTRNLDNAGDFFFLSPAYLNARAGNPQTAKLEKGEPAQTKGPELSARLDFDPVEREAVVTETTAVRAGPSSGSERVTMVERGASVYVRDRVRGQPWVTVERDGRLLGFMLEANLGSSGAPPLSVEPPPPPDPAATEAALALTTSDWIDIQRDLAALGYTVADDGRPGPQTRATIAEWQMARGEETTRFLTDEQRRLLTAEVNALRRTGSSTYRLLPGDLVRVTVFGQPLLSGEYELGPTGKIIMPLIGQIGNNNMTHWQLAARITVELDIIKEPIVDVEILKYTIITIRGEVKNPGSFPFVVGMTVFNAIDLAGGFTYRSDQDDLTVQHNDNSAPSLPVAGNVYLKAGDIVEVKCRFFCNEAQ